MDFTITKYKLLLDTLKNSNYIFQTLNDFISKAQINNGVILRHDVDRKPENALKMAQIENELGIKASYYFRVVPESYNLRIMKEIAKLGHEIGYHYEDVDLIIKNYKLKIKNNKDKEKLIDLAYESFCKNLEMMRKNFDIKTICMHGSPRSKYDNKLIWSKYDYRELGIIGEPYFDIDFNEVFYLTDAGRAWNNTKVNRRDKVKTDFNFKITSILDFIDLINKDKAPQKIMLNIHPHNWGYNFLDWTRIYIWQSSKNLVKRFIIFNEKKVIQ